MPRFAAALSVLAIACTGTANTLQAPEASIAEAGGLAPAPVDTTAAVDTTAGTVSAPVLSEAASFVVWMPDGLHPDFSALARGLDGVGEVTIVQVGTLHIAQTRTSEGVIVDEPPPRFVIPAQGVVLEPDTYRRFVRGDSANVIASLAAGEIALSSSSAELRRLTVGDRITLEGGIEMTVAAVLEDEALGSAEMVTSSVELAVSGSARAYALVEYEGSVEGLEDGLNEAIPGEEPVRVRARAAASGRQPTVRSQLFMKLTFGEFAYRPISRGRVVIDPAWVEANIETVDLPLLGRTTCHIAFNEILAQVMHGLLEEGLSWVIDRGAFRGCWVPRYIANSARLSRHSWGVAADINFGNSLSGGPGSPLNEELLVRMAAVGIRSGHLWTRPDPGHFEYYGLDDTGVQPYVDAMH